ncbi:hypothetical protein FNQ90_12680 [Streptomyces alkaliphilus]|uniref:Addiction module toxin, HicA family n=1 Tax=Streptomyces alkaliphilus TaxID=1472722 RepID=A0A7W3TDM5_9ACTN|nr:type II toxin-antitoxin system HicA family toxin [Streptomyces alkaliphilus]MBB0244938.1 hypothetical protein [Streptomyces alkaliphilus]
MIKKIREAARGKALPFHKKRRKGSHEYWTCGFTPVVIPHHREINEITAESICKQLEDELGEGWWR